MSDATVPRDEPAFRARIPLEWAEHGSTVTTWLVEFSADGGVLRQIGLDEDDNVIYRCGPEEYGVWNDAIVHARTYTPGTVRSEFPGTIEVDADTFETRWMQGTGALGRWPNQRSLSERLAARLRRLIE